MNTGTVHSLGIRGFVAALRTELIRRGYEAEAVALAPECVDFWRASKHLLRARFMVRGWPETVSKAADECGRILRAGGGT